MAALGLLCGRSRVGHGPRGLQRRTATRGTSSRTTRRGARRTAGAKTGSPGSAIATSCSSFAPAFWNGRDPILKERMFGLTSSEGNRGEDVKDYYFYLDATPTQQLHEDALQVSAGRISLRRGCSTKTGARRRRHGVRAARHAASSTTTATSTSSSSTRRRTPTTSASASRRSTAGRTTHELHVLPHLWFRNTWGWGAERRAAADGSCRAGPSGPAGSSRSSPTTRRAIRCRTCCSTTGSGAAPVRRRRTATPLFTNNETNARAVCGAAPASAPYTKDAFHRHVVNGEPSRQPRRFGTKACVALSSDTCRRGGSTVWHFRLTPDGADGPARRRRVDRRDAARGGRRVLRGDASAEGDGGREAGAAAGARRHVVDEADLSVRRRSGSTATTRTMPPPASRTASATTLAPPQLDAHPVDAGQVGVSVVRGVGPRVPLRGARAGRSGASRRRTSGCCCSSSSSTRTGRSRPTSGSSPI